MASFSTIPVAGMASLNTNEIVVAWLASEHHHAATHSTSLNTDAQDCVGMASFSAAPVDGMAILKYSV